MAVNSEIPLVPPAPLGDFSDFINKYKENFWRWPDVLNIQFDKLSQLVGCGTSHPEFFESDRVTVLFCLVPAKLVLWLISISSLLFLLIMAGFYMTSAIVFYQLIPWALVFLLTLSVILAMALQLPCLLVPFRFTLALSRLVLIILLLLSIIYTLFSCFGIHLDEIFSSSRPPAQGYISPHYNNQVVLQVNKKLQNAVLMVPGCILSYLLVGIAASAATRVAYFFKRNQGVLPMV